MDRLGIDFKDCFRGRQILAEKAVHNSGLSQACVTLDELQIRLEKGLEEIKPELQNVDPPLAEALETARRKIMHNVQRLKSRVVRFEGTRNSSILASVECVLSHCYPNQTLQERELGIQHFLARHGLSLIDEIGQGINLGVFEHHVVWL